MNSVGVGEARSVVGSLVFRERRIVRRITLLS